MKSRISFFNGTVLKKDITRFAPLWGLYTLFLIIVITSISHRMPVFMVRNVTALMNTMAYINLLYSCICASVLFGDLFQSRMCNALHAMPLQRESWFITHVVSGLFMSIIPNTVAAALMGALMPSYYYMALLWLAVVLLQFLFFFGVAVFSTMCAGNRLGMVAVCFIINCFSLILYVLTENLYEPLLYGIQQDTFLYQFLSPVFYLGSESLLLLGYNMGNSVCWIEQFYMSTWYYLFAVAGIGVVLMILACLLYRKRKLETAGDFLALAPLKPVFLVIYTLTWGAFLYVIPELFGVVGQYFFVAIGIIIGFFTGKMLLERTTRVFYKKNILRFALLSIIFVGSLVITSLDPIGITRYIPEVDDIASMRVYDNNSYFTYGDPERECWQLETPEEIDTFRQVHSLLINERGSSTGPVCQVEILYQLNDGTVVRRYYEVGSGSAAYSILRSYFSDYRYVFNTTDYGLTKKEATSVTLSLYDKYPYEFGSQVITDPEKISAMMDALWLDCQEGNMAGDYAFHADHGQLGWIWIGYAPNVHGENIALSDEEESTDLIICSCATHVTALLDEWLEEHNETH